MSASKRVLLLSDNPGWDYVGRIRTGAAKMLGRENAELVSINIHGQGKTTKEVFDPTHYGGLIVTPPVSDDRHFLSHVEASGIPFVRIAALLDPERGCVVGMDEFEAASAVTAVLTAAGHRRIGIVRGPSSHLVSMRRYNGYANALGAKGMRVDQALVVQGDFTRESGRAQAGKLFAAGATAIFASNDDMAAGIIDAAARQNIAIPGDISLVGYDDNAVATQVRPQLTTVRQPCEAMGEAAATLIAARLRNPRLPNEQVVVPFEIVERESVRVVEG
ncbi:substrate-binding domain-containing protein [Erythrobacter sp. SDW2]|uniref:substrate-binding domain-containing protein n=1 Tax=Erythrobacter sp. SDW2 TaxID=2907154 RepID=UPI001F234E45|nr:substrate-binding domain-containing protein [Erythrobacter sp. SDW2]UIP06254.1 substrate-binding domain-containing protein [Erythrobacter sp. SDW2]